MKKAVLVLIVFAVVLFAQDKKKEPQQFETKITIIYNSIPLDKAAELEKKIKKEYGDACSIELELKKLDGILRLTGRIDSARYYPIYQNWSNAITR